MGIVIQHIPAGMKMQVDQLISSFSVAERNWAEQQAKLLASSQRPLSLEAVRRQITIGLPGGKPASPAQMDRLSAGIIAILIGLLLPAVQTIPPAPSRALGKDFNSLEQLRLQQALQHMAAAQQILSNILKTRQDVSNNLISNMKA